MKFTQSLEVSVDSDVYKDLDFENNLKLIKNGVL